MKLIKVHASSYGDMLINVAKIDVVKTSESGSVIFFLNDSFVTVTEDLDTIIGMVNETNNWVKNISASDVALWALNIFLSFSFVVLFVSTLTKLWSNI